MRKTIKDLPQTQATHPVIVLAPLLPCCPTFSTAHQPCAGGMASVTQRHIPSHCLPKEETSNADWMQLEKKKKKSVAGKPGCSEVCANACCCLGELQGGCTPWGKCHSLKPVELSRRKGPSPATSLAGVFEVVPFIETQTEQSHSQWYQS